MMVDQKKVDPKKRAAEAIVSAETSSMRRASLDHKWYVIMCSWAQGEDHEFAKQRFGEVYDHLMVLHPSNPNSPGGDLGNFDRGSFRALYLTDAHDVTRDHMHGFVIVCQSKDAQSVYDLGRLIRGDDGIIDVKVFKAEHVHDTAQNIGA
jgi:hypothetical protein